MSSGRVTRARTHALLSLAASPPEREEEMNVREKACKHVSAVCPNNDQGTLSRRRLEIQ